MEKHYDLSDTEFELQFKSCTLEPSLFTHEAHLRLAWIHISRYGIDHAIKNMCGQIKMYAESLGAHDKFNRTVTIASVRAVHHFMKKSEMLDFPSFIRAYPELKTQFKQLLATHYSFDLFASSKAKKKFIEPDLLPFD